MRRQIAIALGALLLLTGCQMTPENVNVSLEAPTATAQKSRFVIKATVENTAAEEQKLVSLDVGDEYLEGIVIEKTVPPFKDAFHVPIDNTMSYTYDINIAAGRKVTVLLHAYAAKTGDFSSAVDFCINSNACFLSYPIRTIVE